MTANSYHQRAQSLMLYRAAMARRFAGHPLRKRQAQAVFDEAKIRMAWALTGDPLAPHDPLDAIPFRSIFPDAKIAGRLEGLVTSGSLRDFTIGDVLVFPLRLRRYKNVGRESIDRLLEAIRICLDPERLRR